AFRRRSSRLLSGSALTSRLRHAPLRLEEVTVLSPSTRPSSGWYFSGDEQNDSGFCATTARGNSPTTSLSRICVGDELGSSSGTRRQQEANRVSGLATFK